jgi:hypothetical protein
MLMFPQHMTTPTLLLMTTTVLTLVPTRTATGMLFKKPSFQSAKGSIIAGKFRHGQIRIEVLIKSFIHGIL